MAPAATLAAAGALPPWLGDPALHRSHQSNLVRKDPAFYKEHFPDVPDDLPYVWPVRSAAAQVRQGQRVSAHVHDRLKDLEDDAAACGEKKCRFCGRAGQAREEERKTSAGQRG